MRDVLLVALGGAVGACGRFGVALAMARFAGAFPWATLLVNVVGGFAMGVLLGLAPDKRIQVLVGVGVLGGFTTFSSFSIEVVRLLERGALGPALFYVVASVALSVLAAYLGLSVVRALA